MDGSNGKIELLNPRNIKKTYVTFNNSFSWSDGKFDSQYHSPVVGDRLFSVDYANGSLFVVNGPEFRDEVIEIRGYAFDMTTGGVTSKFGSFIDPHDIAVSSDAKEVRQSGELK